MAAEDRFRRDGATESPVDGVQTVYASLLNERGYHAVLSTGLYFHKNGFIDLPAQGEFVFFILSVKTGEVPFLIDWVRGEKV